MAQRFDPCNGLCFTILPTYIVAGDSCNIFFSVIVQGSVQRRIFAHWRSGQIVSKKLGNSLRL